MSNIFDVIVVGAGHAGIEAAYASSRMGSKTLLLTLDTSKIAVMPCNPSIGGLGKGHIVYEISALGGLMPQLCSKTYLQARMLNTRKGPAVQGLRLQIDKHAYSQLAQKIVSNTKNLTLKSGSAVKILTNNNQVTGLKTKDGTEYQSENIVITAGTFLNGTTHIGFDTTKEGRSNEQSVKGLTKSLEKIIGVKFARLKTGTPPRLLKSSLDFSKMQQQKTAQLDHLFEFSTVNVEEKERCYITHTNEQTCKIIKDNFEKSALFGGKISGIGPRYCPSIEDKVKRHPERTGHHIFVEPEGKDHEEIYPAGLSTSLPLNVQTDYIRSIKGFENAIISQAGYAVEYDFLQPNNLKHSLEVKNISGLFFAGQINGTTGYEEAAGQGIIAGINAHLKSENQQPFILSRNESYIGVMIDDLITLGVDEPYRMFTSRAERRLILRQDNVFLRLMPHGKQLGLVDEQTYAQFLHEKELIEKSVEILNKLGRTNELFKLFHSINFTNEIKNKAKELLIEKLDNTTEEKLTSRAMLSIHAQVRYAGYLEKERKEIEKTTRFANLKIPTDIKYLQMPGLSVEMQQKLNNYRPKTIAQAQLIPGMTPAAVSILIFQSREIVKQKQIV